MVATGKIVYLSNLHLGLENFAIMAPSIFFLFLKFSVTKKHLSSLGLGLENLR